MGLFTATVANNCTACIQLLTTILYLQCFMAYRILIFALILPRTIQQSTYVRSYQALAKRLLYFAVNLASKN